MFSFLTRYSDHAYALMRIVTGFLFLFHGTQKLFGAPGGVPEGIPSFIIYIAGPIELVGGALLMLGLFATPAAFLCSGLMAAAYFLAHAANGLLPIVNQGELAAIYCFVFLYIAATGAGIWSVDGMRQPQNKSDLG